MGHSEREDDDEPDRYAPIDAANKLPREDPVFRKVWKAQRKPNTYAAHKAYLQQQYSAQADGQGSNGQKAEIPNQVIDFERPNDFSLVDKLQVEGSEQLAFGIKGKPGFVFLPKALTREEEAEYFARSCVQYATNLDISETNLQRIASRPEIGALFTEDNDLKASGLESSVKSLGKRMSEQVSQCGDHGGKAKKPKQDAEANRTSVDETSTKKEGSVNGTLSVEVRHRLWKKLKWATLGYHFDWDQRAYVRGRRSEMPGPLVDLAQRLCHRGGYEIRPETAIVNFYGRSANMGAHKDDSELAPNAPVLSVTFGCPAIFVLGGDSLEDEPVAMYVRGGDAMLLGGESRHAIHGVPCAFPGCSPPSFKLALEAVLARMSQGDQVPPFSSKLVLEFSKLARVNINVRQVFPRPEDANSGADGELITSNPDWKQQYIGMGMGKT